jgi:hypothetical protein
MPTKPSLRPNAQTASRYASPRERIAEFNANDGSGAGGLLSLSIQDRASEGLPPLNARLYRLHGEVLVTVAAAAPGSVLEVDGLSVLLTRRLDGRLAVSIDGGSLAPEDMSDGGSPLLRIMVNDACIYDRER